VLIAEPRAVAVRYGTARAARCVSFGLNPGELVIEREWREASDMRQSMLTLALVLGVAALLRFWALDSGLPHGVAADEASIVNGAVRMMRVGTLDPGGFFEYPTLYVYVQMAVACVRFLVGAVTGEWGSLAGTRLTDFYLPGRAVTAALGTATVFVTYRIGLRWGARYALLAAGLLAVVPLHVRESHYAIPAIPLTFFVALTFLLSLNAHERPATRAFVRAGATAGLAAATDYAGALAVLLPLLSAWMTRGAGPRHVMAMATAGASVAAFIVAAPYTVLDLPGFLNGFARVASATYAIDPSAAPAWSENMRQIQAALHWPAIALLAAGAVLAAVRAARGPGRVRWMLAVVFPVVYFMLASRYPTVVGRGLLAIVPFLCILVSVAVVSGVSLLRRFEIPRAVRTALIAAGTVAALLPPALDAIAVDRTMSREGTTELAYAWILDNVPEGSSVVVETARVQLPGRYKVTTTPRLLDSDLASYRESGVQYLVASSDAYGRYLSAPQNSPREYAQYMLIFEQSRELARFSPSEAHPGPELRILKVQP
jgi:hypothetical protein